ncbi:hypothetical protein HJFPF1_13406 [Paramyrothecium foliicola]|nr:hypothetical protein HJFPF1_13406 [Paramyrothecium foliicola]
MASLNDQYGTIDDRMSSLEKIVSRQLDVASTKNQMGLKEMLKSVVAASVFRLASPEERDSFLHLLDAVERETKDLSSVIRQNQDREYDVTSKSYYAMILDTRRFHEWLNATHSDLIYVEGPFGPASTSARQSPMSYFCANLVTSKAQERFYGVFLPKYSSNGPTRPGRWWIFHKVLLRLTKPSLQRISVVDWNWPLEKPCWEKDYWLLLNTLGVLVYDKHSGFKFKILITSPVATMTGQIEICRYLLSQTTYLDAPSLLRRSLHDFVMLNRNSTGHEEMYRLFLGQDEFEADINISQQLWLERCRTLECMEIILHQQYPSFSLSSTEQRFELASRLHYLTAPAFLRCIGLPFRDERLTTIRNSRGASVLHYIALRFRQDMMIDESKRNLKDLVELGVSISEKGADPCSIAHDNALDLAAYYDVSAKENTQPPLNINPIKQVTPLLILVAKVL